MMSVVHTDPNTVFDNYTKSVQYCIVAPRYYNQVLQNIIKHFYSIITNYAY